MTLTEEEKDLIAQALQLFMQQVSMQLPPQQVQQLMGMAKAIIGKLDHLEAGNGQGKMAAAPAGISDEWYEKVCQTCPSLSHTGCTDKITAKFPGKCDPILKYERAKAGVR